MTVHSSACPVPVDYAPDFLNLAVEELTAAPEKPALGAMLADYARLRDQARACRK